MVFLATSFLATNKAKGTLDVAIEKASFIMPAAHKVYGNKEVLDGKYHLFKAKITNKKSHTLEDVTVRYRIPDFIEWTELEVVGEMFQGQSAVIVCYPKFADDITEKTTESVEKVEIEISWDGATEDDVVEEEFTFKLTNRNDYVYTGIPGDEISTWSDVFDNNDLLACFVTPNDPVLKYYTQKIQEKVLKGDAASVSKDPKEGVRFLMGIYEATLMSHMVYSGTKGIPQSLEDVSSMVQHVRLPREVITGNTGLCIELSVLYASMMSSAGIDPVIFLTPGHAFPGFKMNDQYYAIEPTAINGEGLGGIGTSLQALEKGQEELVEFIQHAQAGDPRYTIVDIHELNQQGVTSMSLPDNDFLRQKVNEIADNFTLVDNIQEVRYMVESSNIKTTNVPEPGPVPERVREPETTKATRFAIPNGWVTYNRPFPEMPILTLQAIAPDQATSISIYDISAATTYDAMLIVSDYLSAMGLYMEYEVNGNQVRGQTSSANGVFNWVGKMVRSQSGLRIITIGAPDYVYYDRQSLINSIFNSI